MISDERRCGIWSEPVWIDGDNGGIEPSLLDDVVGKGGLASSGRPAGVYRWPIDGAAGALLWPGRRRVWKGAGGG